MISNDIIRKFVTQIKEKHPKINESGIEKDFYLTLILNEMSEHINQNQDSVFSKLVFKGGTLLTRTHLKYHRISEDLDFTYLENKKLNEMPLNQRKKSITKFTDNLVIAIYEICEKYGMSFSREKTNEKYCKVMNRKNVYIFKVYYDPVYGREEFIKFEVNFNDELIYNVVCENIKHLFDDELINDMEFVENIKINIRKNILCYDLKEIAGEKIRAVLTRPSIKERDLLDLFLISTLLDLKKLETEGIIRKITSSKSFIRNLSDKIENNLELLRGNVHILIEEKSKLSLVEINARKYSEFEKMMIPLIVKIGEQSLIQLK